MQFCEYIYLGFPHVYSWGLLIIFFLNNNNDDHDNDDKHINKKDWTNQKRFPWNKYI